MLLTDVGVLLRRVLIIYVKLVVWLLFFMYRQIFHTFSLYSGNIVKQWQQHSFKIPCCNPIIPVSAVLAFFKSFYVCISFSFSLLLKGSPMSTLMSFIVLTGLELMQRFVYFDTEMKLLILLSAWVNNINLHLQEVETYFSEGLTKWRDLNLTVHFSMSSSVMSWLIMRTKQLSVF